MITSIRNPAFAATAALLSVVALAGCGAPEAIVTGTVLVDGELAERGQVAFYPVSGGPPALATIRDDGSFIIAVGRGDKINPDKSRVAAGDYVITVTVNGPNVPDEEGGPPSAGARLSGEQYASRSTSPLKQKIVDGPNVVVLDLDRAPVAEAEETGAEAEAPPSVPAEGESDAPEAAEEPSAEASEESEPAEADDASDSPQPPAEAAKPAEAAPEAAE